MNMATEGFDDAQFQTSGQPQDRCIPVFYTRAVEDKEATLKQGRPMFRDVAYVQILVPGNNKDIMDRAVKEEDKQRWPRADRAAQRGEHPYRRADCRRQRRRDAGYRYGRARAASEGEGVPRVGEGQQGR